MNEQYQCKKVTEIYNQEKKIYIQSRMNSGEKIMNQVPDENLKNVHAYISKHIKKIRFSSDYWVDNEMVSSENMKMTFDLFPKEVKTWFKTKYFDMYQAVLRLKAEDVKTNEVNLFKGYKHIYKPFADFPKQVQDAVHFFIDAYLTGILCNGKKEHCDFMLKWIGNMVQGNRNKSVIVMKGNEGIGKSTLLEFLKEFVLGLDICINQGVRPLASDFNYPLMGKLLVTFEEIRGGNKYEMMKIASNFKNLITNDYVSYKAEHQKPLKEMRNLNSYITTSNDYHALMGDNGRRFWILDISEKHRDDKEFFFHLRDKCFNDVVGHAFFCYAMEVNLNGYFSLKFPITERKKRSIALNYDSAIEFVRATYLFQQKHLDVKSTDLYKEYVSYCHTQEAKYLKKKMFYEKMAHWGLHRKKSNGLWKYKYKLEELGEIAKRSKWDIKDDNYESDGNEYKDEDPLDADENTTLKLENERLKKELAAMRKECKQLTTKFDSAIINELCDF